MTKNTDTIMNKIAPPFPENIDRNAFGFWLSGFTDGEGCFSLTSTKRRPMTPLFRIGLRDDDIAILKLIWSYFQCGAVRYFKQRENRPNTKRSASFEAWKTRDLAEILVPHFDQFPLMSKKANDFAIWKEAVLLSNEGVDRKVQHKKGVWGCLPKWTDQERRHFAYLTRHLKEQREYKVVA